MKKGNKALGNALLLFTALIWGTAFVFQRVGTADIGPFTFTAARMALSAAAVGAVALVKGSRRKRGTPEEEKAFWRATVTGGVLCGVFLALASILQQAGLAYTTAGKAGFITAMYMLLVPVLGFVLFRRKNSWLVWLAVLTGVAGMYLLCVTEDFRLTRGDALVCACALLFSGHILCSSRYSPRGDPVAISAIQFCVAALVSALPAFLLETPDAAQLSAAAVPILYCGLASGGLGYTLQIVALGFTDPTVASLLMSLESVFAALAGALLLQERMSGRELLGCAVLFAAILLVQLPLPGKRGADVPPQA